ncbi:iron-containing alcohol dehydrogenase family protein [Pantoea sp. B65]|uniref:iron-containing alcohol dehydrogenase family protein n=1 Tax=Pantoea sp. B65 TaxID=2813359 RepID=UPI0039B5DCA7
MLAIKSPHSYLQQPGLAGRVGEYIAPLATRIAIISSPQAWRAVNPQLEASLQAHHIEYHVDFLAAECSAEAIAEHQARVQQYGASLVLGIGGGRVLDTAKAVANNLDQVALVTLPTLAATCAAWSPVSIIYNAQGGQQHSVDLVRMPVMVLVDSEVIAHSDVRYLKAGIVDALAKWYEFIPYQQKNADSLAMNLKVQAARMAVDTFEQYGAEAVGDNQQQKVTPALIKVIDANIALAGMANSMRDETPAPGVAHAIHNRLTHQPELHHWLHGEKVGFCLLVQSLLESGNGQPDARLLALLRQYDAPLTLSPLRGDRAATFAAIAREVKFSAANAARLPFSLAASAIEQALLATDRAF